MAQVNRVLPALLSLLPLAIPTAGAALGLYLMANVSRTQITVLQDDVAALKASSHEQDIRLREACSQLKEVETQFRASDQVRNLMHVDTLRIQSMLWRKAFGADYPTGNVYLPTIAQEHPQPCS